MNISELSLGQQVTLFRNLGKNLRNSGYLSYAADGLYSELSASFLNTEFEELYNKCVNADTRKCLGDFEDTRDKAFRWRLHILLTTTQACIKRDGIMLDLGCGSGMIASALLEKYGTEMRNNRMMYHMFDSFEGAQLEDLSTTNSYEISDGAFEMASSICTKYSDITKLHQGYLPQSLISMGPEDFRRISFISLDLNAANPEIKSMQYLIRYLQTGCMIVLDDFGFQGSKEQNIRHIEFCSEHNLPLFHLPTGQGLIVIGEK